MNVNELHDLLTDYRRGGCGEMKIVLAADEEGNSFHHLQEIGDPQVLRGNWELETVWNEEGTEPLTELPDDNSDVFLAMILWP